MLIEERTSDLLTSVYHTSATEAAMGGRPRLCSDWLEKALLITGTRLNVFAGIAGVEMVVPVRRIVKVGTNTGLEKLWSSCDKVLWKSGRYESRSPQPAWSIGTTHKGIWTWHIIGESCF